MGILKCIVIYPCIVILDIIEFVIEFVENIIYVFKRSKYRYEDIVAVEYISFIPADDSSYIIYDEGKYNLQDNNYDKIINLSNSDFISVVEKMREENILKYNNIGCFNITSFSDLLYTDGGTGEEILKIYFKNDTKHQIRISRESKRINSIVESLYENWNIQ